MPEMVKVARSSMTRLRRVVILMSVVFVVLQAVWFSLVMLIPDNVGRALFGPTWYSAQSLFVAWGVAQTLVAIGYAPFMALRAMGAASRTLSTRFAVISLNLTSIILGAVWGGAMGVAVAAAIVGPVQAALWWTTMETAIADAGTGRRSARWRSDRIRDVYESSTNSVRGSKVGTVE